MFRLYSTYLNENQIKFYITDSYNIRITYQEFLHSLVEQDEEFFKIFREGLNKATKELSAYFWECVPATKETIDKPFEFVVTKSEVLNNITQDYSLFQSQIDNSNDGYVCNFLNHNEDATLFIPIPKIDNDKELNFKNISEFTKNASLEQQRKFWNKVAWKTSWKLTDDRENFLYLSTHGLGANYLHVKLDKNSNQYFWKEYKEIDQIKELQGKTITLLKKWKDKTNKETEFYQDLENNIKGLLAFEVSYNSIIQRENLKKLLFNYKNEIRILDTATTQNYQQLNDLLNDWNNLSEEESNPQITNNNFPLGSIVFYSAGAIALLTIGYFAFQKFRG